MTLLCACSYPFIQHHTTLGGTLALMPINLSVDFNMLSPREENFCVILREYVVFVCR